MISEIVVSLETWRDDPAVHVVLLKAADERAFCAGGDVRSVRELVLQDRFGEVEAFFVHEYALNRSIARYPKPYISLIDGICMGGGIGLAVHGDIRVATEHASFAMPETQLGLFPDVGGSYFLPRLRGAFGIYMGLTGARIGGADACWVGLATHYVPRARIPELVDAISTDGVSAVVDYAEPPVGLTLPALAGKVDRIFSLGSIESIKTSLQELRDDLWAQTTLAALNSASPSALHWTFDLLRAGSKRSLEQCQHAEILLTRRACRHPDFVEGVRANVVDKDRKPLWQLLEK